MAFYASSTHRSESGVPPLVEARSHRSSIEVDALSSALHSALHPFNPPYPSVHGTSPGDHHMEMHPEKSKSHLDISFHPETLYLKGTGPDVEPALLSGHVSLYLTESTSIKEITLSFRGKARLPVPSHEPYVLSICHLVFF